MTRDVEVIQGDCLTVMRGMVAGSVNAVVTDPPFGVRSESWDDKDQYEFARFTMAWLAEAKRVAPELLVFCNQDDAINDLCRKLYKRVRRLIWSKPEGSQLAGGRECGVWYSYECVLHCHEREGWSVVEPKSLELAGLIRKAREAAGLSRGAVDIAIRGKKTGLCFRWEEGACLPTHEQFEKLKPLLSIDGDIGNALGTAHGMRDDLKDKAAALASKYAARSFDVLTYPTVTRGRHPCEKPLGLMIQLLETIGEDYESVLDPFAGSGTTAVACMKTGRRCIAIESDPRYCEVIEWRVRDASTPLFALAEGGAP